MAETKIYDTKSATGAEAKVAAEVSVEDFSGLVANISRILAGVSRLQPFVAADLGLAEWVALTMLVGKDGTSNKVLARHLGVTSQRANQIVSALARAKLIEVKQSADDNRVNEIRITDAGKKRIGALNEELKALLATAFEGKERVVTAMAKQARHVVQRIMRTNNNDPVRLAKRADREAKKKGQAAKGAA